MRKVTCQYCGREAAYVDSAEIYRGRSYGMIYLCRACDAYVGVHRGTDKPLGILAKKDLRLWKNAAHLAFDPLWKSGKFTRRTAYRLLSEKMGLPEDATHIGMFDIENCKRAIAAAQELKIPINDCCNL